jgi:exoribonuclease R
VGIHISDVAALVLENTAIDLEAQSRISSTYILKKFHKPMLPPQLNENICCLKPGADRLAVTLWVNIDSATGLIDYTSAKYQKTIINNSSSLNYGKADTIIKSEEEEDDIK